MATTLYKIIRGAIHPSQQCLQNGQFLKLADRGLLSKGVIGLARKDPAFQARVLKIARVSGLAKKKLDRLDNNIVRKVWPRLGEQGDQPAIIFSGLFGPKSIGNKKLLALPGEIIEGLQRLEAQKTDNPIDLDKLNRTHEGQKRYYEGKGGVITKGEIIKYFSKNPLNIIRHRNEEDFSLVIDASLLTPYKPYKKPAALKVKIEGGQLEVYGPGGGFLGRSPSNHSEGLAIKKMGPYLFSEFGDQIKGYYDMKFDPMGKLAVGTREIIRPELAREPVRIIFDHGQVKIVHPRREGGIEIEESIDEFKIEPFDRKIFKPVNRQETVDGVFTRKVLKGTVQLGGVPISVDPSHNGKIVNITIQEGKVIKVGTREGREIPLKEFFRTSLLFERPGEPPRLIPFSAHIGPKHLANVTGWVKFDRQGPTKREVHIGGRRYSTAGAGLELCRDVYLQFYQGHLISVRGFKSKTEDPWGVPEVEIFFLLVEIDGRIAGTFAPRQKDLDERFDQALKEKRPVRLLNWRIPQRKQSKIALTYLGPAVRYLNKYSGCFAAMTFKDGKITVEVSDQAAAYPGQPPKPKLTLSIEGETVRREAGPE